MVSTEERILMAARDIFAKQGLSGLSMRIVATKAGMSATAIYRHFQNKEDLVYRVMLEGHRIFGAYMFESLVGSTPWQRMELGSEAYIRFALEHSQYYHILFSTPLPLGKVPVPEELQKKGQANFQFLIDRVSECMEAGILKSDDAYNVSLTVWAQCHGLMTIWFNSKLPMDTDAFRMVYGQSMSRLFSGLTTESGKAKLLSDNSTKLT